MPPVPGNLDNVSLKLKANVYFDGGVVSHAVIEAGGARRTVGLIRPGAYHFDTGAPERMEIIAGACAVKQAGAADWTVYRAGQGFDVPGKSSFDIRVDEGLTEYLCSYR